MSGQEIYDNFKQGAGGAGLADGAAEIKKLIETYQQRAESITQLTVRMESAWQGDAAGAARRGAGPLAVEHGLAAPEMNTAQDLLFAQVSAYDAANNSVVPVPPVPEKPGFWDNMFSLGEANRTYEQQQGEVNTANDNNVAVMSSYEDVTGRNTSGMPTSYGSIEPDYSAIGVLPQPETPPEHEERRPPPQPGGDDRQSSDRTVSPPSTPPSTNGPGDLNTGRPTGPQSPTQLTTPDNFVPTPPGPPGQQIPNLPNGPQGPHGPNGPFIPGGPYVPGGGRPPGYGPGSGFGPTGGGADGGRGSGAGGRGFGPGAGGAGAVGEEGARSGARAALGAGGAAAEASAGRGAAGAGGRGGMGGMPMGGGARGQGDEDAEHQRPSYLVEADPDATFGTDEVTAPPVIGE